MSKIGKINFNPEVKKTLEQVSALHDSVGDTSQLQTQEKTLVGAINEVKQFGNSVKQRLVSSLLSVDSGLPITIYSTWDEIIDQSKTIQISNTGTNDINGIIERYKIHAGETVSAGDFVEFISTIGSMSAKTPIVFESANSSYISAVMLNEIKVLVSFSDEGNGGYGTAVVLTIDDTYITAGPPVIFESANISSISAVKLNENKVLLNYRDIGNSNYGTAIVLSINGSSITTGSPIVFESASTSYISAVALNENKVVVSYRDIGNSGYGTAIVLTINGSSITAGSPIVFESANTTEISAVALSENKVIVGYRDDGNSYYSTAIILTINGSSISKGTPTVFENTNTTNISAVKLSENKVIVSYRDNGNSAYGTAIVLTINGNSITKGSPIVFNSTTTSCISAVLLNANKVLASYRDESNNNHGTSVVLSVDDTSITIGSPIIFNSGSTAYISAVPLNKNKVLVSYQNKANSNYGTSIIINANIDLTIKKSTSREAIHGVAQMAGTDGQTITVKTLSL